MCSPHKAWIESGPFTWFQEENQAMTSEDKLDMLQRSLMDFNVAAGRQALADGCTACWLVADVPAACATVSMRQGCCSST